MCKLSHRNLIQLNALVVSSHSQDCVYTETKLYSRGDLRQWIDSNPDQKQVATVLHSILLGLQHMHDMGVWHRDLKPQNILLDEL